MGAGDRQRKGRGTAGAADGYGDQRNPDRKLPWGLVLLGVFLVIAVELLGIRSLSFAVGAYLSIATTLAIFGGGIVRWMVDRAVREGGEGPKLRAKYPGITLCQRTDCGGRHRRADGRGAQAL